MSASVMFVCALLLCALSLARASDLGGIMDFVKGVQQASAGGGLVRVNFANAPARLRARSDL